MLCQTQLLPPPSSTQSTYSSDILYYPLRLCGKIWTTAETLPKSLLSPLLVPATIFAGSLAAIGTVVAPLQNRAYTQSSTSRECSLLQRTQTDQLVKDSIQKRLTSAEIPCSVRVSSLERNCTEYYSGYIHRYITVQSSSCALSRLWARLKLEFFNDAIPSIESLPQTLLSDTLVNLQKILAVYKSVEFSLAFDLAYIRVETYA